MDLMSNLTTFLNENKMAYSCMSNPKQKINHFISMMSETSFPTLQETRYFSIRETLVFVLNGTSLYIPKIIRNIHFYFVDNSRSLLMLKQQ